MESRPSGDADGSTDERRVNVHETRPGRQVFALAGNSDAWIATDLVVSPEP